MRRKRKDDKSEQGCEKGVVRRSGEGGGGSRAAVITYLRRYAAPDRRFVLRAGQLWRGGEAPPHRLFLIVIVCHGVGVQLRRVLRVCFGML